MDTPSTSRPSPYARRLLLPTNAPPPPIPPALRTRFLQPRISSPPKPAAPKWIDGGEFALARSSSTSHTRGTTSHRRNEHLHPTGPPVVIPFHSAHQDGVKSPESPRCSPHPQPPLQTRRDLMNCEGSKVKAGPHLQPYHSSSSHPPVDHPRSDLQRANDGHKGSRPLPDGHTRRVTRT